MADTLLQQVKSRTQSGDNRGVLAILPDGWAAGLPDADRAMLHFYRADAAHKLGHLLDAVRDYKAAYDLIGHVADPVDACWVVNGYAVRQGKKGNHAGAASMLAEAYCRYEPSGVQAGYVLWNWAWESFHAGDTETAFMLFPRAEDVMESIKCDDVLCVLVDHAKCLLQAGVCKEALNILHGMASRKNIFSARWLSLYYLVLGQGLLMTGREDEAETALLHAYDYAVSASNSELRGKACALLASLARCSCEAVNALVHSALGQALCSNDSTTVETLMVLKRGGEVSR